MTALDAQPVAIADDAVPAEARGRRKRPRHVKGTRPGWFVYACLGVVLLASVFPFYWSLLIGSGDSYTIRDPNMSWIPGGNFFSNAAKVMNDPAVNFWVALWNSIISSGLIALSVVFFSTLAGWAFAKLRFRGSSWLLVFVIATMAVPTQLGVVPLYILFSDLGWTGQLGAIIVPALVSAFGVFWMTQYLGTALPDELIEAGRIDGANMIKTAGVTMAALANSDGTSKITVAAQSLGLGGTNVTVGAAASIGTVTTATAMIATLATSITNVSTALSKLGTGSKSIASHLDFVGKLQDSIDAGVGNLVDADLAKESAKLTALQTKQQLGIQALGIANQSSSQVLSLFR